jgi:hypothetical protein
MHSLNTNKYLDTRSRNQFVFERRSQVKIDGLNPISRESSAGVGSISSIDESIISTG